jgi:hypothetical protein
VTFERDDFRIEGPNVRANVPSFCFQEQSQSKIAKKNLQYVRRVEGNIHQTGVKCGMTHSRVAGLGRAAAALVAGTAAAAAVAAAVEKSSRARQCPEHAASAVDADAFSAAPSSVVAALRRRVRHCLGPSASMPNV